MSKSEREDDPLVGDELIRITLETYEVHFKFAKSTVQIGAPFLLKRDGQLLAEIQPAHRVGQISQLWQLVGQTVSEVVWTESIQILFGNHLELLIPPSPGRLRGAILGEGMTFEEF